MSWYQVGLESDQFVLIRFGKSLTSWAHNPLRTTRTKDRRRGKSRQQKKYNMHKSIEDGEGDFTWNPGNGPNYCQNSLICMIINHSHQTAWKDNVSIFFGIVSVFRNQMLLRLSLFHLYANASCTPVYSLSQ